MAVEPGSEAVIFRAQFHLGDVRQINDGPVAVAAQADLAELFGRLEPRLRRHGGVHRLAAGRWRAADLPSRTLRILRADGRFHVAGRSEGSRVGKGWVTPVRIWWAP